VVQEGRRRGLSDDFRRAILERVKSKLRFNRTLEVLGISRGSLHNYLHGLRRVPDDVIYRALQYLEEWEFNEVVRGVDMLRTAGIICEDGTVDYYVAVHYLGYSREGGRVRKCYLRPELYDCVSRIHQNLGIALKGAVADGRVLHYLDAFVATLNKAELDRPALVEIANKLEYLAITVTTWPMIARIMRAQVMSVKERLFVEAARAIGAGNLRILFKHVIPHALPPALAYTILEIGAAIMMEAGLSYLGLGDPNYPSWGRMIYEGQVYVISAPWISLIPGAFVVYTLTGINLLGNGLMRVLVPRRAIK